MKHKVHLSISLIWSMLILVGLPSPLKQVFPARAEETQPQEATFLQDICTTTLRIMPLGDSITKGNSSEVAEVEKMISYRKDLWDSLQAAGYDIDFVGSQTNGQYYTGFDAQHEGYAGQPADWIRDNVYTFLSDHPADVVLLHIGTNDINSGQPPPDVATEVSEILEEIDQYEADNNLTVIVLLARIIHRVGDNTAWINFNNALQAMVDARIATGDDLVVVNQETGAGLIYQVQPAGDMYDNGSNKLHPYHTGYTKMANVWKQAIDSLYQDCNQAPVVTNPGNQTSTEYDQVSLQIEAADPEQDVLTFTADGLPPGLSMGRFTGLITGRIAANASEGSPYRVIVTVTDDGNPVQSSEAIFNWVVSPLRVVYVPLALVQVSR